MMTAPSSSTMIDYAAAYTSNPLNWRLCRLRPNSKAPMLAEWNKTAIGPDEIHDHFASGIYGIGLVHSASETGTFDIDSTQWTRFAFAEFGIDLDEILVGYPRPKGKPGHDKIIFHAPKSLCAELTTKKLVWPAPDVDSKPITLFELRGNGGQDVLPPSIHPDTGIPYAWEVSPFDFEDGIPPIPEILLTIWQNWKDFEPQFKAACPWAQSHVPENAPPERLRQCSSEHQNVIGKFNDANPVHTLLESHGYIKKGKRWLAPTSSTGIPGVVVLKENGKCYSHHASCPLNDGHAHDSFDVFCILRHNNDFNAAIKAAARELGIDRKPKPQADISAFVAKTKKTQKQPPKKPAPRAETPCSLLNPPGVLGLFANHIVDTAQLPQPEIAVASALSLCATALGRKVATETGLRTNLYIISVAKTAHGKEHARRAVKEALLAARLPSLLGGEEIASGQGLLARVSAQPVSLFQIDEFGLFLQAVQNSQAGSHLAQITTNLIKLFSAATSIYYGTEYADQKSRPRIDIPYPCVLINGTTTPETLFKAIGSEHVSSGYLNRILFCFAPDSRPVRVKTKWQKPPQELIEWITSSRNLTDGSSNLSGLNPDSPIIISNGKDADFIFDDFQVDIDRRTDMAEQTGTSQLWGRALEHATKIALVCEMATDINSRAISAPSATWAVDFVRHWTVAMEAEVMQRVSDSDFGRLTQEIMRMVKNAGETGMTERELSAYSRLFRGTNPSMRDMAISAILRDEDAFWVTIKQPRGKSRKALIAREFLDIDDE